MTYRGDDVVTFAELKEQVRRFVEARNWQQGHRPKNLAMSIAIEAAEIMEHFQWQDNDDYLHLSEEQKHDIAMEVADVLIYMMSFSNTLGIDLAASVQAKMEKNETRFPVEPSRT